MGSKVWAATISLRIDKCKVTAYAEAMRIRNFSHKGLKKLYEEDNVKGLPPDTVDKLRKMLIFLDEMDDPEELRSLPSWRAHLLAGDRKGMWSLTVTGNRRLTFRVDPVDCVLCDVNFEDYH